MLEKQRAATDIPSVIRPSAEKSQSSTLADTPGKLSRSFSALYRRKDNDVSKSSELLSKDIATLETDAGKKPRPKSTYHGQLASSVNNLQKRSFLSGLISGSTSNDAINDSGSLTASSLLPNRSASKKVGWKASDGITIKNSNEVTEAADKLADLGVMTKLSGSPSLEAMRITSKTQGNQLHLSGSTGALDFKSISSKTKSMPKISSLFRSKNNQSNAKTRSISASPHVVGGSIPALQTTVLTLSSINHVTNVGNSSANPLPTPLSTGGKMYGLSAYEMHKPTTNKSFKLEDFHIVKRVGKGGFASVYLVRLKTSAGRYWALKVIRKSEVVKLKQEKQILNEKNILMSIRHPFIVELSQTFQDQQYLYMVLEYLDGGDLFTYLRKCQRFTEEEARFYVAEVLIALEYLHSVDVVYRDLKPENILLDSTGHIKLADFGFAKIIKAVTNSFCGTPDYIAAEIVAGKPYNKSVDWWSLGVLIFELGCGKTPFSDDSSDKVYDNIQAGNIKWSSIIRGSCRDIIGSLLKIDHRERLGTGPNGAKDIKAHAWFEPLSWSKLESRQCTPPYIPIFEAPHIIETHKPSSRRDEVLESMKPGSWLNGDPFYEAFKDF